jgi:hypothetical protein
MRIFEQKLSKETETDFLTGFKGSTGFKAGQPGGDCVKTYFYAIESAAAFHQNAPRQKLDR